MENLYNAKVSFKGEGNFTFTLPKYGELTVYNGRDIYIKGLNVNAVELLRQLRPLLLDHQLNAKPDGCYKVLDLTADTTAKSIQNIVNKPKAEVKSVADLKADLVKTTGPIVEDTIEEEKEPEAPKADLTEKEPEAPKTATKATSLKKKNNSKKSNKRKTK